MKEAIENQITSNGLEFSFIAEAHTEFGNSFYYRIGDFKCRFSDHSVTNSGRIQDEIHFNMPIQKTIGLGGVIKEIENKNLMSFLQLKKTLLS